MVAIGQSLAARGYDGSWDAQVYERGNERILWSTGRGLRSGCRLVNIASSVKMFEGAEFERGGFLVKNADLGWGIILYSTWPLQKS
jgi:hypothetical protein